MDKHADGKVRGFRVALQRTSPATSEAIRKSKDQGDAEGNKYID